MYEIIIQGGGTFSIAPVNMLSIRLKFVVGENVGAGINVDYVEIEDVNRFTRVILELGEDYTVTVDEVIKHLQQALAQ